MQAVYALALVVRAPVREICRKEYAAIEPDVSVILPCPGAYSGFLAPFEGCCAYLSASNRFASDRGLVSALNMGGQVLLHNAPSQSRSDRHDNKSDQTLTTSHPSS